MATLCIFINQQSDMGFSDMTGRLEANSEKGPRNHFREDGMLEDVTHVSSLV